MSETKHAWGMCPGIAACAVLIATFAWGAAPEETTEEQVMLFPIVKDGKWGYMDETGKVVIEPQYDGAGDFSEGLARVAVGLYRGYIDKAGTMVIKPLFGWACNFHSGMAAVYGRGEKKPLGSRDQDIWGDDIQWYRPTGAYTYVNRSGKLLSLPRGQISPPPMDFSEGKACNRNLCIDTEGKAIEHDAEDLGPFAGGLAAAKKEKKWGYIDHDMKWVIEPQFTLAGTFSEDLAPVVAGDAPAPRTYRDYDKLVKEGKVKWGYIDKSGTLAIECQFEDAWIFSEGLAPVRRDGKWGYIDTSGKVVIEPAYDYAWPFSEGRGRVLVGEKQGFVDTSGKAVVEPAYDAAWEFSRGLARVALGEKEGYIDRDGTYVWEPTE